MELTQVDTGDTLGQPSSQAAKMSSESDHQPELCHNYPVQSYRPCREATRLPPWSRYPCDVDYAFFIPEFFRTFVVLARGIFMSRHQEIDFLYCSVFGAPRLSSERSYLAT